MVYKKEKGKERKRKERKGGEGKGKRESDIKLSVVPTITEVPVLLLFASCPVLESNAHKVARLTSQNAANMWCILLQILQWLLVAFKIKSKLHLA